MRYLLILSLLLGCSNTVRVTPDQANKCKDLANTVNFGYYISDTGTCVLKKSTSLGDYSYYIPLDQLEGAFRIVDLQRDMAREPLLKACYDECRANRPKPVCPGDKSYNATNCAGYCHDAVNLDKFEKKTK